MLMHPLFQTLLDEPELLADHAGAYAQLVGAEANLIRRRLVKRWVLLALAASLMLVAMVLAGVAVLIWHAALPTVTSHDGPVFWAVPAAPAVLGLLAWGASCRFKTQVEFPLTRQQLAMDRQLFHRKAAA